MDASTPNPSSPASISKATFPTSRKGFDREKVKAFLVSVAAEMQTLTDENDRLVKDLSEAQQRAVNEQVIAMLEHLVDDARSREDADRRMVAKLSKHVLDRVAVVDHLYFIVAELETKLRKFEAGK